MSFSDIHKVISSMREAIKENDKVSYNLKTFICGCGTKVTTKVEDPDLCSRCKLEGRLTKLEAAVFGREQKERTK